MDDSNITMTAPLSNEQLSRKNQILSSLPKDASVIELRLAMEKMINLVNDQAHDYQNEYVKVQELTKNLEHQIIENQRLVSRMEAIVQRAINAVHAVIIT